MTNQIEVLTMPEAIDALSDSASFTSDEPLAVAGRKLMAKHARKLYKHLPGAAEGDDPHHVHQARVATRRLRASLQATAPAYRQKSVKQLRKQLRTLAKALGTVRDYDVLLIHMRADAEQLPEAERAPLLAVIERMQHERDAAHTKLVGEIRHKRTNALLQNLNEFLLSPIENVQAQNDGLPLLVRHYAGSSIWQRFEQVRQFETVMPQASSTQLHELRIACKRLRYTLELFESALPENAAGTIERVTAMQEHLGDLHDTDVALDYLGATQCSDGSSAAEADAQHSSDGAATDQLALSRYIGRRQQEREQLLAGVSKLWDNLTLVTPRRKLARLIAEL